MSDADRPETGEPMPFTRLDGRGQAGDWWKWVLDLDPLAPATVPTGPGLTEADSPTREPHPSAEPGDAQLRAAAAAGHRGDETAAAEMLAHPDPRVRVAALGSLERMGRLTPERLGSALADPVAGVRRRACELGATRSEPDLTAMLADEAPVAEMAAWALGERGNPDSVGPLAAMAVGHADPLCREAAVAALGAIGDPAGLSAILAAASDRPAVRRRAVIALAPFQGPEVDAALARALEDRDWQVRQAAEDLLAED